MTPAIAPDADVETSVDEDRTETAAAARAIRG
jgi:hypothetical protein